MWEHTEGTRGVNIQSRKRRGEAYAEGAIEANTQRERRPCESHRSPARAPRRDSRLLHLPGPLLRLLLLLHALRRTADSRHQRPRRRAPVARFEGVLVVGEDLTEVRGRRGLERFPPMGQNFRLNSAPTRPVDQLGGGAGVKLLDVKVVAQPMRIQPPRLLRLRANRLGGAGP